MSTQPRTWNIDGDPLVIGLDDQEELMQALVEATTILTRIGGSVIVAAERTQIATDVWQTSGFIFKWSSFFPGKRMEPTPLEPDVDDPDA